MWRSRNQWFIAFVSFDWANPERVCVSWMVGPKDITDLSILKSVHFVLVSTDCSPWFMSSSLENCVFFLCELPWVFSNWTLIKKFEAIVCNRLNKLYIAVIQNYVGIRSWSYLRKCFPIVMILYGLADLYHIWACAASLMLTNVDWSVLYWEGKKYNI
jgi:hypothetical protein